jgi:HAD superfamily hydrolase (TIGR01490 family)
VGVALFDLDNTLLGGDSDYLWGEFLVGLGVVPGEQHRRKNERFLREYQRGELDTEEFLAFQLKPLADNHVDDLLRWRQSFVESRIAPLVLPKGQALVAEHRRENHELAIVTSTNSFITRPIAELFGIVHLLATEPEFDGECYTGRFLLEPCSGHGKVTWVQRWLARENLGGEPSWFYTDSHQDIPLLELVTHPVAVDPDEKLARYARTRGWEVRSLR